MNRLPQHSWLAWLLLLPQLLWLPTWRTVPRFLLVTVLLATPAAITSSRTRRYILLIAMTTVETIDGQRRGATQKFKSDSHHYPSFFSARLCARKRLRSTLLVALRRPPSSIRWPTARMPCLHSEAASMTMRSQTLPHTSTIKPPTPSGIRFHTSLLSASWGRNTYFHVFKGFQLPSLFLLLKISQWVRISSESPTQV